MKDILGAFILIGALFAFGMFDFKSEEPLVDAGLLVQAKALVGTTTHPLTLEVKSREIRVAGYADSLEEQTHILDQLRAVEGRGRVVSDLIVLEPVTPYALRLTRPEGGALELQGPVPTEQLRAALRDVLGDGVEALTLASGAPDAQWGEVALRGAKALMLLDSGQLENEERVFRLSGVALTPEIEARIGRLFADLPEGYVFEKDLELRDDGSPMRLSVTKMPTGALRLSGKLPEALDLKEIDTRLAGQDLSLTPIAAPFEGWGDVLATGLQALDQLQSGNMTLIGSSFTLSGEAWSEAAYQQANALVKGLPQVVSATSDVVQMDDGAPFDLTVAFDGTAAVATGKAPVDLGLRVQSAFLDHPVTGDGLVGAQVSAGQDWWQAAIAGIEALKFLEHGAVNVTRDRVRFTELAFNPARQTRMARQLAAAMPEGVDTQFDLTYLDDGTPFRLSLAYDGAAAVAGGKVPQVLSVAHLSDLLGVPVSENRLVSATLEAPADWIRAAEVAAGGLSLFENGEVRVLDDRIAFNGLIRDPAQEQALQDRLSELPEGFAVSTALDYLDDGRPFYLILENDGETVTASGKVPHDMGPRSQSAIFGRAVTPDELFYADVPASPEWWEAARRGIKALAMLERGTLTVEPEALILTGFATDGARRDGVTRRLVGLADGIKVEVDISLMTSP